MFAPRFWFKDKLSSGVALFSKTAPGHRLSEQLLQHVYVYWLTHSVELRSKEIAPCSQKKQHPAPAKGQTKIHIDIKKVQNGTLYKGNNDVAKGFIGCHVISIMILPVQYAFSVQCTRCRWPEGIQSEKSSLAIMCCLPYQKVQFKYKYD